MLTSDRPMSLVNNQTEMKHDIRVDSCRRTSLLLAIPAGKTGSSARGNGGANRNALTDEAEKDQEGGTNGSSGEGVRTCDGGKIFGEGRDPETKEGTNDVEAREFELLCEILLYGKYKLLESED